jgi:hypothetical protein
VDRRFDPLTGFAKDRVCNAVQKMADQKIDGRLARSAKAQRNRSTSRAAKAGFTPAPKEPFSAVIGDPSAYRENKR